MLLLVCTTLAYPQDVAYTSSDLPGAKKIAVNKIYQFPVSPSGYGKLKEFTFNAKHSPFIFKEERNTIWLQLDIPYDGGLTCIISPHNVIDDYDWMLYTFEEDLENKLQKGTALPLRSNNSRNDTKLNSKTGMRDGQLNIYSRYGPGNGFSSPLQVKKGAKLVLVIDNIYGGSGFDFSSLLTPILGGSISGIVKSKTTGLPVHAEVFLEDDSTGRLISKTLSDPLSGKYILKAPLNWALNITAVNPGYLFSTDEVILDNTNDKKVDLLLDTITTGNKLVFFNIHFKANKDEILPSSQADLTRLTTFLKEKPEWIIKIIGHTNNNVFAEPRFLQTLSFERAIAVKTYLLKTGISEKRISCAGQGGKVPLIVTKDSNLAMKNLRVEVVLMGK